MVTAKATIGYTTNKVEDLPEAATCSWCGKSGMWVIEDHRWVLKNKDGSRHVHQPPKHEN